MRHRIPDARTHTRTRSRTLSPPSLNPATNDYTVESWCAGTPSTRSLPLPICPPPSPPSCPNDLAAQRSRLGGSSVSQTSLPFWPHSPLHAVLITIRPRHSGSQVSQGYGINSGPRGLNFIVRMSHFFHVHLCAVDCLFWIVMLTPCPHRRFAPDC